MALTVNLFLSLRPVGAARPPLALVLQADVHQTAAGERPGQRGRSVVGGGGVRARPQTQLPQHRHRDFQRQSQSVQSWLSGRTRVKTFEHTSNLT